MGKFKEIIEILSKVSTVGIFILALFGYFYTVKPKFELDNLKLSMESVKKEKNDLEFQIKEYNDNINKLKIEKEDLVNSISNKESYIDKLNKKINHYNLNLFVVYLFNGNDIFNKKNGDYINFVFSFLDDDINDNKFELLKVSENYKFFLNNDAPYILLINKINNFKYDENMLFTNEQFLYMKKEFINKLNLHKNFFVYDSNYFNNYLLDLNNKRQVFLDLYAPLKESLKPFEDRDEFYEDEYIKKIKIMNDMTPIEEELYKNKSEYRDFLNKEYKKINLIIQKFINEFIFSH